MSMSQLFGFDVLIDANMKPWLFEVNTGPSLENGIPDSAIKSTLVVDMMVG
jgi:tubulin polyglutamylase TTLL4